MVVTSIQAAVPGLCYRSVMIKLLKQILNDEGQELKRLALILLLLASGAMASRDLARHFSPGAGPHLTVHAAPSESLAIRHEKLH